MITQSSVQDVFSGGGQPYGSFPKWIRGAPSTNVCLWKIALPSRENSPSIYGKQCYRLSKIVLPSRENSATIYGKQSQPDHPCYTFLGNDYSCQLDCGDILFLRYELEKRLRSVQQRHKWTKTFDHICRWLNTLDKTNCWHKLLHQTLIMYLFIYSTTYITLILVICCLQ